MWLVLVLLLIPSGVLGYDRIISLSPQITESLYLMGADDKLIGVTDFCKRPMEATKKERVGTPLRPDVEKIVSMKPEIVLGSREGNSPLLMARLERLGLRIHYFHRSKSLEALLDNFLTLSRLVGKEKKGESVVAIAKAILERTQKGKRYRVLWQVGADPPIVASTSSFANDIIWYAGGENIIESELPYLRINAEEVLVKTPHIVVVMDHGYNIRREIDRWRGLLGQARFVTMDAYAVGSPTPLSFADAVNKLARAMGEWDKEGHR